MNEKYADLAAEVQVEALLLQQIEIKDIPAAMVAEGGPLYRGTLIQTAAQSLVLIRALESATVLEETDEHVLEPTA